MYMLISGTIDVAAHGKVLEQIGPGDSLGIVGLIDDKPRIATAQVREPCQLVLIERKKFRYMVEEGPNFVWYGVAELVGGSGLPTAAL